MVTFAATHVAAPCTASPPEIRPRLPPRSASSAMLRLGCNLRPKCSNCLLYLSLFRSRPVPEQTVSRASALEEGENHFGIKRSLTLHGPGFASKCREKRVKRCWDLVPAGDLAIFIPRYYNSLTTYHKRLFHNGEVSAESGE
jgi:hypothetical protein